MRGDGLDDILVAGGLAGLIGAGVRLSFTWATYLLRIQRFTLSHVYGLLYVHSTAPAGLVVGSLAFAFGWTAVGVILGGSAGGKAAQAAPKSHGSAGGGALSESVRELNEETVKLKAEIGFLHQENPAVCLVRFPLLVDKGSRPGRSPLAIRLHGRQADV